MYIFQGKRFSLLPFFLILVFSVANVDTAFSQFIDFTATVPDNCNRVQFHDTTSCVATWWEWSFGDGNYSNAESPLHVYATAGTFTVGLRAVSCGDTLSITKPDYVSTQNNQIPVASITGTNAICLGETAYLTANGGFTYQWSGGSNSISSNIAVAPVVTTVYNLIAYMGACASAPVSFTVVVTPNPVLSIAGDNHICTGESTTLTVSGADTYQWTGVLTGTDSVITVMPDTVTTYRVTGFRDNCQSSTQITVQVSTFPTVSAGADVSICSGSSATLTASGGIYYSWNNAAPVSNPSITVSPVATTTYYVTSFNGGCHSLPDSVTVTVTQTPIPAITGNLAICRGQSTTLTASGGSNLSWSGGIVSNANPVSVSPISNTTYTVTIVNGNCTASASATVNVTQLPVVAISGNTQICAGQSTFLSASGAQRYRWSGGANDSTTVITINPTVTTTYIVTGYNGNCAGNADSVLVVVTPIPSVSISGDTLICKGDSVTLHVNGNAAVYQWGGGINSSDSVVRIAPAFTSTITVIGYNGICNSPIATHHITVLNVPTAEINGDTAICAGTSITLNGSGGGDYVWSGGATANTQDVTVEPTTSTTYYLMTKNGNCESETDTFIVNVYEQPVADFSYQMDSCNGDIIFTNNSLNSSSFIWDLGDGNSSTQSAPRHHYQSAGLYDVTLIASPGSFCADTTLYGFNIVYPVSDEIIVPNIFTPNDDNLNDRFEIQGLKKCQDYSLRIFTRWGRDVFTTSLPAYDYWDGKTKSGAAHPEGIYLYMLKGENTDLSGTLMLKR